MATKRRFKLRNRGVAPFVQGRLQHKADNSVELAITETIEENSRPDGVKPDATNLAEALEAFGIDGTRGS